MYLPEVAGRVTQEYSNYSRKKDSVVKLHLIMKFISGAGLSREIWRQNRSSSEHDIADDVLMAEV